MAIPHFVPPPCSFVSDGGEPFFGSLMFQKFGKQRIAIFLFLDGSPCGGELSRCYLIRLVFWIAGKSHIAGNTSSKKARASFDDASFFETEIAISPRGGSAHDDVIQQLDLQDSAGFENSPGKAHIRFGGGRLP